MRLYWFMTSSRSAGDGNYFIEAQAVDEEGRRAVLFQSPALSADQHDRELWCVCRAQRALAGDTLLQQLECATEGGIKGVFEDLLSSNKSYYK